MKMDDALAGLGALPRQSLRDGALRALRSAIVLGQIPPGQHLSEVALSSSLGISRGTLREALGLIQREGLAVEDERGRLRVPQLTARSVTDTFQVREALEAMAGHLIATNPHRDEAIAVLQDRVGDMEKSTREGSILDQVDADLAFHRAWCLASGNAAIVEGWDQLAGKVRMAILFAGPEKAVANMSPARHLQLVECLVEGDSSVVVVRVHQHFAQALRVLAGGLDKESVAITR